MTADSRTEVLVGMDIFEVGLIEFGGLSVYLWYVFMMCGEGEKEMFDIEWAEVFPSAFCLRRSSYRYVT